MNAHLAPHLAPLIRDLAVILSVAGLVSLLFQRIRQPVVLGYLIAGAIVGPHMLPLRLVTDLPNIRIWAELGVIFLMFTLGLDFSFRKLAKVGISASLTSIFEVSAMMLTGFVLGRLLRWSLWDSLFLGGMLSISSTTVIVKALDELRLRSRRFAEMIFGVLIVEDLVAVLILVGLSTLAVSRSFAGLEILYSAGKLLLVIGSWFLAGYFVVPRLIRYVGRTGTEEMLTIVSLGLCLFLAVFAAYFDYSVALGAFIMGSILAESTESQRIESLMTPLRDLFAAVFFVSVGMLLDPSSIARHWDWILLITVVYALAKITSVTIGALITGQTLRTAVQVGFGMAQIGEFSFIMATLGQNLHVTSEFLFPVAVAVSLITTFMTPYLIRGSHKFAVALEKRLPLQLRDALSRYAAWTQERRADVLKRRAFYQLLFRWFLNGLVVTVVFILVAELIQPWLDDQVSSRAWSHAAGWTIAIALSSPFLWAMLMIFRGFEFTGKTEVDAPPGGGVLLLARFATSFWVGVLSIQFFPARFAMLATATVAGVIFLLFYRQIGATYHWFERRFLSTFEPTQKTRRSTDVLKHLAPWDAHLVRIKVHPNSDLVGRTLRQAELRSRHGVNVVAIQRGLKSIVAPRPDEAIFPKDELLVLGTDEQIDQIRYPIEKPPGLEERFRDIADYELRQLRVAEESSLVDKSIRDSGIGERFHAMVVGLERGDRRMINPDSDEHLRVGDVLWVVGQAHDLAELAHYTSGEV